MINEKIDNLLDKMIDRHGADKLLEVLNADNFHSTEIRHKYYDENLERKRDIVNLSIYSAMIFILVTLMGVILNSAYTSPHIPTILFSLVSIAVLSPILAISITIKAKKIKYNLDKFQTITENYNKTQLEQYIKNKVSEKYISLTNEGNIKKIEKFNTLNNLTLNKIENDKIKTSSLIQEDKKLETIKNNKYAIKEKENLEENTKD